VARIDVKELLRPAVDLGEHEGHEVRGARALEDKIVQAGGQPSEFVSGVDLGQERGPQRGHEQGGADALARDVGDDQADPVGVEGHEIEVVAADLIARDVEAGDVEAVEARAGLGQEGLLDARGLFQVGLDPP